MMSESYLKKEKNSVFGQRRGHNMFEENKRLTIGFMIHHLDNDYSKELLRGAADAAKELDVNLAVFPGRSLNSQLDDRKYTAYEYQYNVIYSYVSAKTLDAVVVSAGTLGSFVSKEEFRTFLNGFEGLPIITTENKVDGYPCIRLSGSGIKELVTHLVKHHGKKHIAFVSGPKGNSDADERLSYYIEALEENGIDYDPDLVAYGKFSEYCVDIVGDLIDRNNGKIDAICFANDMMCKGGYKAIERRGLRVGADIAVTGYDDSEIAVSLKPPLTTVRAEASLLGKRAVIEAVKLAQQSSDGKDISLDSAPVFRSSCGCSMLDESDDIVTGMIRNGDIEGAVKQIFAEHIPQLEDYIRKNASIKNLLDYSERVFEIGAGVGEPINNDGGIAARAAFARAFGEELLAIIAPEDVIDIMRKLFDTAKSICGLSPENMMRRDYLSTIAENCYETAAERIIAAHYKSLDDAAFTHFLISNITKDMTIYGNDEEKCFFAIVNNLYRVHMDSSYIYTYEKPVFHSSKSEWRLPEMIYLKAYHDGDRLTAVTGEAQKYDRYALLNNDCTPNDRRRTMVVAPLFMNEEQYGVIVCELDNRYFTYIYSITPQICTAIKLTNLVGQLETSLDAAQSRNNILDRMSMSDELTGIYNRRGFYVNANRLLKAPENEGRNAVLIFGDLDNLKKINDTFGHDDGDYAIISASSFLKNGLRTSDIVGRIGGDEFAAFAVCDDREMIARMPSRIKSVAKLHNLKSDKPYNVTISVGIYEITCSPEYNIQQFMDNADMALYEDKKTKNKSILKSECND